MTADALRVSDPQVLETLRAAGWSPGRAVDIAAVVGPLTEEGFAFGPTAHAFLTQFLGLRCAPPPNSEGARPTPFDFDVLATAGGELDRWEHWSELCGYPLSPIGEMGHWALSIDELGRIHVGANESIERLGEDFAEGMAWLSRRAPVRKTLWR